MPRRSRKSLALNKLLDTVPAPIYVLDSQRRIAYCNQACADWTGASLEDLMGCECRYHTPEDDDHTRRVAAALCPPPAAIQGSRILGTILCPKESGEPPIKQAAEFLPLADDSGKVAALLVIVHDGEPTIPQNDGSKRDESEARRLHDLVARFRRDQRNRYCDRLIGENPAVRRAREQIAVASASRATIWIDGPPGSGREHAARAIHYRRAAGVASDLIPLSCDLLSADLLRSTVRALEQTSAESASPHHTLLLNEIDRVEKDLQIELAAILAEGFPMQVISTARRSVEELLRGGDFREDLAFALSTITIGLPPLADRREDIPALAQYFIEEQNSARDKQIGGLTQEALDRMAVYSWPGNLDELAEVIRQAHLHATGSRVDVDDLAPRILFETGARRPKRMDEEIVLDDFLSQVETLLIDRALTRSKGNKAGAARLLGVTRPRLYRRMVQLGLRDEEHGDSSDG